MAVLILVLFRTPVNIATYLAYFQHIHLPSHLLQLHTTIVIYSGITDAGEWATADPVRIATTPKQRRTRVIMAMSSQLKPADANLSNDPGQHCGLALAELAKALKSLSFYPQGHPLRGEHLRRAYHGLLNLLESGQLSLFIARDGFTSRQGEAPPDCNPMSKALARELFIRRVQKLTLLPGLLMHDLEEFLLLLTLDPQKILDGGGMESCMAREHISTIGVNEIDISLMAGRPQDIDRPVEQVSPAAAIPEQQDAAVFIMSEELPDPFPLPENELEPERIVGLMDACREEHRYLQLARILVHKANDLKIEGNFAPLFPVLVILIHHSADQRRSLDQREYALFIFDQVAGGEMADFLLQQLVNKEFSDLGHLFLVIRHLGPKVLGNLIHWLCSTDSLTARKNLANAIIQLGNAAAPSLLPLLKDDRWYVVRNMLVILGEIGTRECLPALKPLASHADERIRKEAVRCLAKIGGEEVETLFIRLLAEKNPELRRGAISALGTMQSQLAVKALLAIVQANDPFLKTLPLKMEALQALGRIGNRQVTPYLVETLRRRFWLAGKKQQELQIAIVDALGKLRDETVLQTLAQLAKNKGYLGNACLKAIDSIEHLTGEIDG